MEILTDTNFIITCVKEKIDFRTFADENFDEKIEWIVPRQVILELEKIRDRKGEKKIDRICASVGLNIIENENFKIIELEKNPNVDIAIKKYIEGKNIVLATLDKDLKKRITNRILTIRSKKALELIQ
jgi:rRNA-processing protein FCF1